jgi:hypothetical protein
MNKKLISILLVSQCLSIAYAGTPYTKITVKSSMQKEIPTCSQIMVMNKPDANYMSEVLVLTTQSGQQEGIMRALDIVSNENVVLIKDNNNASCQIKR